MGDIKSLKEPLPQHFNAAFYAIFRGSLRGLGGNLAASP